MSTALTANLGSNTLDASLAEIDARTKIVENNDGNDIFLGPFGALNFANTLAVPDHGHINNVPLEGTVPQCFQTGEIQPPPSSLDSLTYLDESLQLQGLIYLSSTFLML